MVEKLVAELIDTSDYRKNNSFEGLEKGQKPEIYTLFCGDSRVESTAITGRPLNRLFGNEVIGNQVLGIMGSAAYPTEHLESIRLVNVMGHVSCGAITSAYKMSQELSTGVTAKDLRAAIDATLDRFASLNRPLIALDAEKAIETELAPMAQFFANIRGIAGKDEAPFYVKHATANVALQTSLLMRMPHIRKKVNGRKMIVTGTLYDFTGRLGERGMIYLVDVNGTLGTAQVSGVLNGYKNNIRPIAELFRK